MSERTTAAVALDIDAPQAAVFAAMTDPARFGSWFMVGWDRETDADVRPGGGYEIRGEMPSGTRVSCAGTYSVVEPPSRLVFSFLWTGDRSDPHSQVPETWPQTIDIRLTPTDSGGTHLEFTHSDAAGPESARCHEAAWAECVRRLAEFAIGGTGASR